MTPPRRFIFLVVGGDGRRIVKIGFSRWGFGAVLGAALLIIVGTGWLAAFSSHYVALRLERESAAPLSRASPSSRP
jgi:hypothetical protein